MKNFITNIIVKALLEIEWQSGDKTKRKLCDMDMSHIENTMIYLNEKLKKAEGLRLTLVPYNGHTHVEWIEILRFAHDVRQGENIDPSRLEALSKVFLEEQKNKEVNNFLNNFVIENNNQDVPWGRDEYVRLTHNAMKLLQDLEKVESKARRQNGGNGY